MNKELLAKFFYELAWCASAHGYKGPSYAEAMREATTTEAK